jgi:hypothetical protein
MGNLLGWLVLLLPLAARGACTEQSLTPGWLWDYDGTIGPDMPVRVTLQLKGETLQGVYFYGSQLKDIRLTGRIVAGERVELDEVDDRGKVTARFEGAFVEGPDDDDDDSLRGSSGCEIIEGVWKKEGSADSRSFTVSMRGGGSGALGRRYETAGAKDDEAVHRAALQFQRAVVGGDKGKVAALVQYPVRVRQTVIRNRKELLAQYDGIFTREFVAAIASAMPRNMFARYDGIMLGNGEVWFGASGKVITLNP